MSILILIGYISLIFGLATRSRFIRIYFCLPLSLSVFFRVAFVESLGQPTTIERLGPCLMSLGGILRAIELLLCSGEPHTTFIHLEAKKENLNIAEQSFWARVKWALSLCCSQRGGGWNWRMAGTPPCPPFTTTSSFVLRSFIRWIANYLSLEALSIIFAYLGSRTTLMVPLMFLHGVMVYLSLHATYEPGCIAWVLLGFGGVEECPPLFGPWKEMRTLRGFWSKVWHQLFRRPITVIPNRTLAVFGLGPDTTGIGAFFITGIFHAITIYVLTIGAIYPCYKTFLFFALQPLGFWLEDRVLGLHPIRPSANGNITSAVPTGGHGVETNRSRTSTFRINPRMGYIWVLIWLSLSARLYFSEMVASGFYDDPNGWVMVPILTRFVTIESVRIIGGVNV